MSSISKIEPLAYFDKNSQRAATAAWITVALDDRERARIAAGSDLVVVVFAPAPERSDIAVLLS